MDAFAVSVSAGLTMKKFSIRKALIMGLYFGIFQAIMPLAGYFLGSTFAGSIIAFDHWVAFILLSIIGGKMIKDSFSDDDDDGAEEEASVKFKDMLPLAIATSIDALAVGVSFAFLQVEIVPAVSFIGVITLTLSMLGVKVGNIFGNRFQSKAELAGGAILVLIGLKILLEHLGILVF
jgi:putative Mn2+ efflux pump MntP